LVHVLVVVGWLDEPLLSFFGGCTLGNLVEDVEVTFSLGLTAETRLLQKISCNFGTANEVVVIENDFDIFTET
jgi:hypothetical protein